MAIIEQLEIRVRVAQTPLAEHDLPDEPSENAELQSNTTSVVQKCIESQPDQNFDVEIRLHPGFSFPGEFDALACEIYVDGVHTVSPLLMQQKYQPGRKALVEIRGGVEVQENGNVKLRKFRFANLELMGLQKIGVIPRSPSPTPLEDRPRESLSREELLQLIERQQTVIEAGKKATKKEQLDSDMEQLERVKRSQSDGEEELEILPHKRARKNAKIQVIDILDD
ncbi:hypothetical protein LTS08_005311 [Lithohypha guttulata]|nr:hypothetical protein LTS08_005311 [Lithohypha guttulata]